MPAPESSQHSSGDFGIASSGTPLEGFSILVIAHDFPPVRSPQAIRARYLCEGLRDAGANVTVLTRTAPPSAAHELAAADGGRRGIAAVRCSPGVFESFIDAMSRRRHAIDTSSASRADPEELVARARSSKLNWKGQAVQAIRRMLDFAHFPDARSAWTKNARKKLREIMGDRGAIDLALLMHEPAAGVLLWRELEAARVPWAVDLADPVLAPYTLRHWRRRAFELERDLVTRSHACSVTNEGTASLLSDRHQVPLDRLNVLPQGFASLGARRQSKAGPLSLLYSGRFYPFRPAEPLIDAVLATDNVTLDIAGPELPRSIHQASERCPERIRVLGELDHETVLRLQAEADVLVSVGNLGTEQTPGKAIEYFGASRPVLHLWQESPDGVARLLGATRRGITCQNKKPVVATLLNELALAKRDGTLDEKFDLTDEPVKDYRWEHISRRLAVQLRLMVDRSTSAEPNDP